MNKEAHALEAVLWQTECTNMSIGGKTGECVVCCDGCSSQEAPDYSATAFACYAMFVR